jgi:hypothetical protein
MDFSIEPNDDRLALKLQTDEWEVNVYASADDLLKLREIRTADWSQRRSIQAGESAEATAFWANVGDAAALMIGQDDETWDISVSIAFDVIDQMLDEVEGLMTHPPL